MKMNFSKAAFVFGIAFTLSVSASAQSDSKVKIEGDGYELKIKQEGDEYKRKQKGELPQENTVSERQAPVIRQGETITTVKRGELPVPQQAAVAKKKSTASAKKSNCGTKVAARKPAAKRSVAYRSKKTSSSARVAASPRIVRDTVFVTRVDTVFSVNETQGFAGYDRKSIGLMDNFEKLKIERNKDGKVEMKKEYRDGREEKREFSTEEEFRTYLEFKNF